MVQEAIGFDKDIVDRKGDPFRDLNSGSVAGEIVALGCEQCGEPLTERSKSGGKPKRFCNDRCRVRFHNPGRDRSKETVRETVTETITNKPVVETVTEPELEPGEWCWVVPYQPRIEVSATNDGTIEIEELSERDESENVRICVARSNAVQLARSILYATGFKGVLIATTCKGGYCDVEDGGLPEHFN